MQNAVMPPLPAGEGVRLLLLPKCATQPVHHSIPGVGLQKEKKLSAES
jgi:hypothetical protein